MALDWVELQTPQCNCLYFSAKHESVNFRINYKNLNTEFKADWFINMSVTEQGAYLLIGNMKRIKIPVCL